MAPSEQDGMQGGSARQEVRYISLSETAYRDLLLVSRRLEGYIGDDMLVTPSLLVPLVIIMQRHLDPEVIKWLDARSRGRGRRGL